MKILARFPWLAALMRIRRERDQDRGAIRAIADEAVRARTLAHPDAGPLFRELQSSTMSNLGHRLPGTLNDMEQFRDMSPLPIAGIAAPILVIHGTGDRIVPFAHARRVADEAPNAELMAIEGGEHVSIFTHIDEIRARVEAFLNKSNVTAASA
jgi:pimeloyl-ACP methyl ester carboxylesterase